MKRPYSRNGNVVGYSDSGIYFTERNQERHYFKKFMGYGVSLDILESLRMDGVVLVHLTEHLPDGSSQVLVSYLNLWFRKAKDYVYEHDHQKILSTYWMWTEDKDPPDYIQEEHEKHMPQMWSAYRKYEPISQ